MSESELMEVLRHKGEQRVRTLWREAEEEAERLKAEKESRLENARREITRHLEQSGDVQVRDRLQQALEKSRKIVLDAEHDLARRCYKLAVGMLKDLGAEDRQMLLRQLSEEIPEASWQTVTVNPLDRETAGRLFPDTKIETDEEISAGFDIATADRQIAISNTQEMRLQRSWPLLLPELMRHIREKLDVHESSQK